MARKRKHDDRENHERWLVSYADFMTLLFAFFVMMYAHSSINKAMAQQISEAFRDAMADGRLTQALAKLVGLRQDKPAHVNASKVVPPPVRTGGKPQTVELLPSLKELNESLKKEIELGRLDVHLERRGLVISLREATFFPSGNDTLDPKTLPTLATIATELKKTPNPIRLEGHTDSIPIKTERFRSNWHLSAARAITILDLFSHELRIPIERMAIAGFADTAPVASNQTEEGRARNRRVDIVVLNEEATLSEPERLRPTSSAKDTN
jgi:chemotaxis protein MotB